MQKYYTRACNFYYNKTSKEKIKKKLSLSLGGSDSISFDCIEIISRKSKKIITNEDFFNAGLIRSKNVLVKILGNGKTNHSLNLKVDKASQSAIKLISDKKGKIDYNEKVQKTEKKVNKEEKVKKN